MPVCGSSVHRNYATADLKRQADAGISVCHAAKQHQEQQRSHEQNPHGLGHCSGVQWIPSWLTCASVLTGVRAYCPIAQIQLPVGSRAAPMKSPMRIPLTSW
jgi:hypothetical protein